MNPLFTQDAVEQAARRRFDMDYDSYVTYTVEQMAIGTEVAIYFQLEPLAIMNVLMFALEEASATDWSKDVQAMIDRFMSEPDPE